jgi:SAM-dependent methyltransferase
VGERFGSAGSARAEYAALAAIYDAFNAENDYEMWLGELLPKLEPHGLTTGRLLDVGCGTGMAFEPMLRRGWDIVGCDLSPEMIAQARRKHGDEVELHIADMRELPVFGQFDLVLALNGMFQHLDEPSELEAAFAGMRANLAPGGLVVFDVDSLPLFQALFGSGRETFKGEGRWCWIGETDRIESEGAFTGRIVGPGIEPIPLHARHHSTARILSALQAARLRPVTTLGHREEPGKILLTTPADEERDFKVIHVARAT